MLHQKIAINEGRSFRKLNLELFSNQRRDVLPLSPKGKVFCRLICMTLFVVMWLISSPIHLCPLCMPVWSDVLGYHSNFLFPDQHHPLSCKLLEGRSVSVTSQNL
jgi:hypothetical protein